MQSALPYQVLKKDTGSLLASTERGETKPGSHLTGMAQGSSYSMVGSDDADDDDDDDDSSEVLSRR